MCCMEYGLNYFVRFGTAARPDSATMPRCIKLPSTTRATTKIDHPYNSSTITVALVALKYPPIIVPNANLYEGLNR